MIRCCVNHRKTVTYYANNFEEFPEDVRRLPQGTCWEPNDGTYCVSFAQAETAYIFCTIESKEGNILALSDNWITYKWKAGSKVWFEFDRVKDALEVWTKYISDLCPQAKIQRPTPYILPIDAYVKVSKQYRQCVRNQPDTILCKDGKPVDTNEVVFIKPLDTVWRVVGSIDTPPYAIDGWNCAPHIKLFLEPVEGGLDIPKELGYTLLNTKDNKHYPVGYPMMCIEVNEITELVRTPQIIDGMDISQYSFSSDCCKYPFTIEYPQLYDTEGVLKEIVRCGAKIIPQKYTYERYDIEIDGIESLIYVKKETNSGKCLECYVTILEHGEFFKFEVRRYLVSQELYYRLVPRNKSIHQEDMEQFYQDVTVLYTVAPKLWEKIKEVFC